MTITLSSGVVAMNVRCVGAMRSTCATREPRDAIDVLECAGGFGCVLGTGTGPGFRDGSG